MKTLYELFGKNYKISRQTGRFGIEIETEVSTANNGPDGFPLCYKGILGKGDPEQLQAFAFVEENKYWTPKSDGSLRNFGVEYVLKKPLNLTEVKLALRDFDKTTKGVVFIENAPGTSVHVHMNVQDFNVRTLGVFMTVWTLFENILVEYSGPTRRSNLFTLPVRCAEGNLDNIVKLFRRIEANGQNVLASNDNQVKYAALNIGCLKTFLSLEARSFRGTVKTSEIYTWCAILDRMMSFAVSYKGTPRDIMDGYRKYGWESIFWSVFDDLGSELISVVGDLNTLGGYIERNIFYAAFISDSVKDWKHETVKEEKKIEERNFQYSDLQYQNAEAVWDDEVVVAYEIYSEDGENWVGSISPQEMQEWEASVSGNLPNTPPEPQLWSPFLVPTTQQVAVVANAINQLT